ncbi:MAG TPA: NAD(+) diphosphatase [Caulobacteraceae bacterium]|jgi:NAD+ diphosphatase|nr:NAD(+) diphosphatase [Caulobacteraceae bacterium]
MAVSEIRNVFAGNPLDRASARRGDAAWLAAQVAEPAARAMALWNGEPLVEEREGSPRLAWLPMDLARRVAPGDEPLLFLGLDATAPVFAIDLDGAADPTAGPLEGLGAFAGLRELAVGLSAPQAAMAAAAKAVFEWRRRHRFCAACGAPSRPADAGWKRVCTACSTEHFPRTDPVVIMLPTAGDRCLLGRNLRFRPGLFSALAGFVEPGETLEEACARELKEEAGVSTVAVAYHSSQPWPFPSSLMVGLIAEVAPAGARADQIELEEVRWFTRQEARNLLEGRLEGLSAPSPVAIAHQLLKSWIG